MIIADDDGDDIADGEHDDEDDDDDDGGDNDDDDDDDDDEEAEEEDDNDKDKMIMTTMTMIKISTMTTTITRRTAIVTWRPVLTNCLPTCVSLGGMLNIKRIMVSIYVYVISCLINQIYVYVLYVQREIERQRLRISEFTVCWDSMLLLLTCLLMGVMLS